MNKKNFKDNTVNIDRFFSEPETPIATVSQPEAQINRQSDHDISAALDVKEKAYKINLKLRPGFRKYLDDESWKARKSMTEYLNDLIQADMDQKNQR